MPSLAKHLLNLRVALATAHASWVDDLLELDGLDHLARQLSRVTTTDQRPTDVTSQVIGEIVRCLRMILNTDVSEYSLLLDSADWQNGVARISEHPTLIRDVILCLKTANSKLRTQITELLTAVEAVTQGSGRKLLLEGFADVQGRFGETHRFEWLVDSMSFQPNEDAEVGWKWRLAALQLLRSLVAGSDDPEDRCALRGELQRRGFHDIVTVRAPLWTCDPSKSAKADFQDILADDACPEAFREVAGIYSEEREEDLADLRMLNVEEANTPLHAACNLLIRACGVLPEVSPVVVDILQRCGEILHTEKKGYVSLDATGLTSSDLTVGLLLTLSRFSESLARVLDA